MTQRGCQWMSDWDFSGTRTTEDLRCQWRFDDERTCQQGVPVMADLETAMLADGKRLLGCALDELDVPKFESMFVKLLVRAHISGNRLNVPERARSIESCRLMEWWDPWKAAARTLLYVSRDKGAVLIQRTVSSSHQDNVSHNGVHPRNDCLCCCTSQRHRQEPTWSRTAWLSSVLSMTPSTGTTELSGCNKIICRSVATGNKQG